MQFAKDRFWPTTSSRRYAASRLDRSSRRRSVPVAGSRRSGAGGSSPASRLGSCGGPIISYACRGSIARSASRSIGRSVCSSPAISPNCASTAKRRGAILCRGVRVEGDGIADTDRLPDFGGADRRVDRETIEVIEPRGLGPVGDRFLTARYEDPLKAGMLLRAVRIACGDRAPRADLRPRDVYVSQGKFDRRTFRTDEAILPERFAIADQDARTEARRHLCRREFGEPASDLRQRLAGDDRGAVRFDVVGEAGGIAAESDLDTQEISDRFGELFPVVVERIGHRPVDSQRDATRPQIEARTQLDDLRIALAVDEVPRLVEKGELTISGESARDADRRCAHGYAVHRLDRINVDPFH